MIDGDHRHLLLLGLLRRQEMHGYQLAEFLDGELAMCCDLKKPTAYFLLNKMAEAGWITQEEMREGNRPIRHVYRLTAAGEAAYFDLLRANLAAHSNIYFADDIGLAMLDSLPAIEAIALLLERRAAIGSALTTAQAVPQHGGSTQLVIEHQIVHLGSELAWIDQVIERLSRLPNSNK
jgi:DNA-binding PadR family transcriptional regulator